MKEKNTEFLNNFFNRKDVSEEEMDNIINNTKVDNDETNDYLYVSYLRKRISEKNLKFVDVFRNADISSKYGYRLLGSKKDGIKKPNRDIIIRICYAAGFTLEELNRVLKLCGHNELYSKIKRDAYLIILFNQDRDMDKIDIDKDVNDYLERKGCNPLDNN